LKPETEGIVEGFVNNLKLIGAPAAADVVTVADPGTEGIEEFANAVIFVLPAK
jgi:hypothetical protein